LAQIIATLLVALAVEVGSVRVSRTLAAEGTRSALRVFFSTLGQVRYLLALTTVYLLIAVVTLVFDAAVLAGRLKGTR
jgi:hypothetical protein